MQELIDESKALSSKDELEQFVRVSLDRYYDLCEAQWRMETLTDYLRMLARAGALDEISISTITNILGVWLPKADK